MRIMRWACVLISLSLLKGPWSLFWVSVLSLLLDWGFSNSRRECLPHQTRELLREGLCVPHHTMAS